MSVSFAVTLQDERLIMEIGQRGLKLVAGSTMQDLCMDVTAVHANGVRLNLPALLVAEPLDFLHDIHGIRRHLDRSTGKLGGSFTPRFALPESTGLRTFYASMAADLLGVYIVFQAESELAVRQYLERKYFRNGSWGLPFCAVYAQAPVTRCGIVPVLVEAQCGTVYEEITRESSL